MVTGFLKNLRNMRRAVRLVQTAYRLHDAEQCQEAIDAVDAALSLARDVRDSVFFHGVKTSTLLRGAMLRATLGAKVGDRSAAVESIRDGLTMLKELKPFIEPGRTLESLTRWERWARQYLEWAGLPQA